MRHSSPKLASWHIWLVLGAVASLFCLAVFSLAQCGVRQESALAGRLKALLGEQKTPSSAVAFSSQTRGASYLPYVENDKPLFLPEVFKGVPSATPTSTPTATPTTTPTATFTPRPTGVPPPYTTSYYLSTTDYNTLYQLGQRVGLSILSAQDAIVFLDWGQPWYENGQFGSVIFGSLEFRSISQIIEAVKGFCRGYYQASPGNSHLTLAMGTSNYGRTYVTREHGVAWAQMVKTLNDWIDSPPTWAYKIKISGAIDAEPGWNSAPVTRAWVEGFNAAASGNVYYNFGSCDSCPFTACESCRISNNWTYEDMWYISWGVPAAFTVPEIYLVSGVNAEQWYRVSLYAWSAHGQAIRFSGAMTQYQSCQQKGCTTNTPSQGWSQLYEILQSNPATAFNVKWLTDIKW
ncbi:MAG: hypothetical protein ACYC6L_12135 [Anaerolineae bacterium]